MKILLLLDFLISIQCREIVNVYSDDPKKEFHSDWSSNHNIVQANRKWKEKLDFVEVKKNFVTKMINVPNTIPITPVVAVTNVDETPFCWFILAYDSTTDLHPKATLNLTNGLSRYFQHRCAVGTLDMSYPSNYDSFHYYVTSTPSIIVKYSRKIHEMFDHNELNNGKAFIEPKHIRHWGRFIPNNELEKRIFGVFEKMDSYYQMGTRNSKMMALAMNHYTNGIHPAGPMVADIVNGIHDTVVESAAMNGIYPSPFYKNSTFEEKQRNDEKYYEYIRNGITKMLQNIDIEAQVHKHILSVKELSEIELIRMTSPVKQPDLTSLISFWLSIYYKRHQDL